MQTFLFIERHRSLVGKVGQVDSSAENNTADSTTGDAIGTVVNSSTEEKYTDVFE